MQRRAGWAQFEHIAEHRYSTATRTNRGLAEHVEGCRHRRRIGVIAFIDQRGLAAHDLDHAPHAAAGRPICDSDNAASARSAPASDAAASTASEFIAMWRPGMPSL